MTERACRAGLFCASRTARLSVATVAVACSFVCFGGEKVTVGERFRDRLSSGGKGPWMVVVPAGSFAMGSALGEAGRLDDQSPVHDVRIGEAFAIGAYEVTFSEWDACVSGGRCGHATDDGGWGRDSRPAINVSWNDARAYTEWLSAQTGERYRLPSEAEWEYAGRAGMATPFHTGATISTAQANYDGNDYWSGEVGVYREQTMPVGTFGANPWALHDVHGNVWEWTEDCWHDNYLGAPADGRAWAAEDCRWRVARGGSWIDRPTFLRSASRFRFLAGRRSDILGFRVARMLDQQDVIVPADRTAQRLTEGAGEETTAPDLDDYRSLFTLPETIERHLNEDLEMLPDTSDVLPTFFRGATADSIEPFFDSPQLLQQAARYADNSEVITFLIASGFDPKAAFGTGIQAFPQDAGPDLREGPLHHAARYNPNPNIVEALVKGGADVHAVGGLWLEPPLHLAARNNNAAVVRALVESGADPNAVNHPISTTWSRSPNINGNQALHGAACNEDPSAIDVLIRVEADVASKNSSGFTPLHFAVLCERTQSISALLRHGADVSGVVTQEAEEGDEIHDCTGCTPVHLLVNALIDGRPSEVDDLRQFGEVLKVLVEAGASANSEIEFGMYAGFSPLRLAVEGELAPAVVALLLEHGAQAKPELLHSLFEPTFQYTGKYAGGVNMRNIGSANNQRTLELLLSEKIDVNARDRCGRTPLHRAASLAYTEADGIVRLVEKLLTAGADVNTRLHDRDDWEMDYETCVRAAFTPLHAAAKHDEPGYTIASMLLAAGADASVPNAKGKTARDTATSERMKTLLAVE